MHKAKNISFPKDFPTNYPKQPRKCDKGILLCPVTLDFMQHWPHISTVISLWCWSLWSQGGLQWCNPKACPVSKCRCFLVVNTAAEYIGKTQSFFSFFKVIKYFCSRDHSYVQVACCRKSINIRKVGEWDLEMKLPMWDWWYI